MRALHVDPLVDLGPLLLTVEKPARYTGGEFGRLCKPEGTQKKNMIWNELALAIRWD
jgi:hypothetical protein